MKEIKEQLNIEEIFKYPAFDTVTSRISMGMQEFDNLVFNVPKDVFIKIKKEDFNKRSKTMLIKGTMFIGLLVQEWVENPINELVRVECGVEHIDTRYLRIKHKVQTKDRFNGLWDSVTTFYLKKTN